MTCSRCGKEGHRAAACSVLPFFRSDAGPAAAPGPGRAFQPPARQARAQPVLECYECGEKGHRRADCPRKAAAGARSNRSVRPAELSQESKAKLRVFESIYNDLQSGFGISAQEKEVVNSVGGSDVYGELLPAATLTLLDAMKLGPEDVFVDLGCGTGKINVLAALNSDVGRSVGFELSEKRVQIAQQAIAKADLGKRCAAFAENFITTPKLDDATVCFSCNYTLPQESLVELFARFGTLPRLRLVVTFKNPFVCLPMASSDEFAKSFKAAGSLFLHCSWSGTSYVKVFLYQRRLQTSAQPV